MKTTAWTVLAVLGLAVGVVAQEGAEALARARVLEEQEGDLAAAERAYRAVLERAADEGVKARAALRLGSLLWRLERREEAREWLAKAEAAGGEVATAARAVIEGGDGSQDAVIAARVRELLAQLAETKVRPSAAEKDLRWFGKAAVPTIVRVLEERREDVLAAVEAEQNVVSPGDPTVGGPWWFFVAADPTYWMPERSEVARAALWAGFVWGFGGPDAERFLEAAAADPDVRWRRVIARAASRTRPAEGTLRIVESMLADDDPTGVVPALIMGEAQQLPVSALLPALRSPLDRVRVMPWGFLGMWWSVPPATVDEDFAVIEPALHRALASDDPTIARSAFRFLCQAGAKADAGQVLLLELLPDVGTFSGSDAALGAIHNPELMPHLVEAARALGPADRPDPLSSRHAFVSDLVAKLVRKARVDAALLLDLVELGYDTGFGTRAIEWADEPDELGRAARLLDRFNNPWDAMQKLAARDLPASVLEPLRERASVYLRELETGSESGVRPYYAMLLLPAIAKAPAEDAAVTLSALLRDHPGSANEIFADGMARLAKRSPAEAVSSMLRQALVAPQLNPDQRDRVFQELVRRGDVEAVDLFPEAYELGLPTVSPGAQQSGALWLLQYPDALDESECRHAWEVLLSSPACDRVLGSLVWARSPLPPPTVTLLVRVLAERADQLRERFGEPVQRLVNAVAFDTPGGDESGEIEFRKHVTTLLDEPDLALGVARSIPAAVMPKFAEELRAVLQRTTDASLARKMSEAGLRIDTEQWLAVFAQPDPSTALASVAQPVEPAVTQRIEELATTGSSKVRQWACVALGRLLAVDSAGVLLHALEDPSNDVRDAATAALERIRLYHEQKAFWDRFENGITTSREAAVAKLLAQAKPDQPEEQRLLAIRSLGVLGAPEALPYLIEWSTGDDADVTAAAKKAVEVLLQRAGSGK